MFSNHITFSLVSIFFISNINFCDFGSDNISIQMSLIQNNFNFLTFINWYARSMIFYIYLNIFSIHDFNSAHTSISDEDYIWGFVHLQRFEFVIDCYDAIVAVLDEEAMFHLDLAWVESYFFVFYVGDRPVDALELFFWKFWSLGFYLRLISLLRF